MFNKIIFRTIMNFRYDKTNPQTGLSQFQFGASVCLSQNTTRNWGASESIAGRISQRQGSSSSETGQYPARVTLSAVAATDPNSKTVMPAGLGTSTAPFMPGTSAGFVLDSGLGCCCCWGLPMNQEKIPMADTDQTSEGLRCSWF